MGGKQQQRTFFLVFPFFFSSFVFDTILDERLKMSAENEPTQSVKVVLLGDVCTGAKTSLALRFIKNSFDEGVPATIGAAFFAKTLEVDGIIAKLEIWGLHQNAQGKKNPCNAVNADVHRHGRTGTISRTGADVLPRCSGCNCGL